MKPGKGNELPAVPKLSKPLDVGFLLIRGHGGCVDIFGLTRRFTPELKVEGRRALPVETW